MKTEPKDNLIKLFKNDRKREGKQDPDYNGGGLVNGVDHYADAWINESQQTGRKYLSIKLKPKGEPKAAAKPAPQPGDDDFNDDIPF